MKALVPLQLGDDVERVLYLALLKRILQEILRRRLEELCRQRRTRWKPAAFELNVLVSVTLLQRLPPLQRGRSIVSDRRLGVEFVERNLQALGNLR